MSVFHTSVPTSRLLRATVAALLAGAGLHAAAVPVTSRAALAGNDTISWGQLGPSMTDVLVPVNVTTAGARLASVTNPTGPLVRFDEGDGVYSGNFALGDQLLATLFKPGPISIDFSTGLSRIGAQIMSNDFGNFNGVLKVYDVNNLLLETQTFAGVASNRQNNSAIFIGIARATADIDRVEFNISGSTSPDFAINQVDLRVGVVPEPATLALLLGGLALVGTAAVRRRAWLSNKA